MGLDDIDEDDAPAPPVVVPGGSAATNSVFDAFDDFTGGTKTPVVIHNAAPAQPAPPADDLDFFLSGPAPSATAAAASGATPAAQAAARGQPAQPKANDDLLDIFSNIHISQPAAGAGSPNAHPPPNVVNQNNKGGMFGDMSKMLDSMTSSMKLGQMGLDTTGAKGPSLKEMRTFKTDDKGPTYASNTNGFFDLMNFYELVGVARNATFDQIRAAYKAKSLKLHPDRNPNQHPDDAELYKRVTDAYDVISDEVKRREYDQFLMGGPPMGAPMGGPGGPGGPGPMGGAASPPGPMAGGFPGFP